MQMHKIQKERKKTNKKNKNDKCIWASKSYLRSLLFLISSGGMVQGRFLGRQSNTSSENSEKSTSYSIKMPSVSGSISPACPSDLASRLQEKIQCVSRVLKPELTVPRVIQLQHLPLCKIAVRCPVCDPTDEQGVVVVTRTGTKIFRAISKGNINPWHPVVHRGEQGKGLVWQVLQEASGSS